jgi:serine/threonine protein kinase
MQTYSESNPIKARLPWSTNSTESSGISKSISARLDIIESTSNSPHLFLLARLLRILVQRKIREVFFLPTEEFGIDLGDGATFKVEKRMVYNAEMPETQTLKWVAVKRAKVSVPKMFSGELDITSEAYIRLKAVVLEVEILSHPLVRQHPNITTLLGYSWDETVWGYAPVLVMDLATFGDGRRFLRSNQLSDDEKVALCDDVASGLEVLHTCNIVHGDLKLDNILIYPGASGRYTAKLSDLESSPQSGDQYHYRGTQIYNAPEVQDANNPNKRRLSSISQLSLCDAFSFGLLTLEVLSGVYRYTELPRGNDLMHLISVGTKEGM